ncbi:hypothetical protein HID58_030134 [Brassica napus]|uniref:CRAL-TRIO domain-containing protein n=1 Tax=Brassica napus TaxID=3708 RepID=A0ABQ8CF36_BRANA|nr:hypothetical protein HID58_030134 [Brassica napus]
MEGHHTLTRRIFQLIITVETMSTQISEIEQEQLLEKLEIFKIHGRDKRRRKILRIIGKFFPARFLSLDVLKTYLEEKIFPRLGRKPFSILYVHTGVQRSENFPGISALRAIYDAIPVNVRDNLQEVYFLHPGLQSRLFLATCGRFLFSGGLYGKLRYVSRVDYLWEHVRRNEIEMPEFVYDHDDDLEYRPMMDYGQESDHARVYAGAAVDSPVSSFSMSFIIFAGFLPSEPSVECFIFLRFTNSENDGISGRLIGERLGLVTSSCVGSSTCGSAVYVVPSSCSMFCDGSVTRIGSPDVSSSLAIELSRLDEVLLAKPGDENSRRVVSSGGGSRELLQATSNLIWMLTCITRFLALLYRKLFATKKISGLV